MLVPPGLRMLLRRFAAPYAGMMLLTALVGWTVAILTTLQPLVLAPAIDTTLLGQASPAASWWDVNLNNVGATILARLGVVSTTPTIGIVAAVATAYVLLVTVTTLVNFGNLILVVRLRTALFLDIQLSVYRHVLGLSMSYFVRQRTGELASRLMNDAHHTAAAVEPVIRGILQGGAQLLVYGVLLVRTDAWLTVGVLGIFGVHLLITRALRDRLRRLVVDQFDLFANLTSLVNEAMLSIRVVKCFGAERFEHARFVTQARALGRVMTKGTMFKYAETPLRDVADAVGLAGILLLAFVAFSRGRLSVSGLVLFVVIVRQALVPVAQLGSVLLSLQTVAGAWTRLLDLLETRSALPAGRREAAPLRDELRLADVSFAYDPGREVLCGVSITVRRGETVAIVGRSGAGKSTLGDLVVRLHDPIAGIVTYDGVDVREFTEESYRRQFGVVSQECLLFNATVTENIAYGRAVDVARVRHAARVAHAEAFVEALPHGFDTMVGDRGIRLSGGQRQRIAIARAIYDAPSVLLLDEATSALDTESEHEVQAAVAEATRDATVIVIAHRLSTVIGAHRIVVMNDGVVAAVGTHEELLALSPLYRRLFDAQFLDAGSGVAASAAP